MKAYRSSETPGMTLVERAEPFRLDRCLRLLLR